MSIHTGKPGRPSGPAGDSVIRIEKEMGITLNDFLRLLPAATGSSPAQWERDPSGLSIAQAHGRQLVRIDHGPERERRIASLSLPVLNVTISLSGFDKAEALGFLQRFERHFQRGGG